MPLFILLGRWAKPTLSVTAFFLFLQGGPVAIEHGLQFHPAAPEGDPTRETVAFAVLMAAEASYIHVKLFHARLRSQLFAIMAGQHFYILRVYYLLGRARFCVGGPCRVAQTQQRRRHCRKHRDRWLQPF